MSELREMDRKIRKDWFKIMSKRLKYGTSGAGDLEWLVMGKNQGKRISQVHELHIENLELEKQIKKLDNMFSIGIYMYKPHKIKQKIEREKKKLTKELEKKQKLLDMAQEINKVILSIKKQIKDMEKKMYFAKDYDLKKRELEKKNLKYDRNLNEIKRLMRSLERNIFSNERESTVKKSASRSTSRSTSRSKTKGNSRSKTSSNKRKHNSMSKGGKRKTRRKRKKRTKRTKKHLKIKRKKQRVKTRRRRRR
tara:strand:+ start:448 stop:1200 length:753 start_codon:yes stop_codon:yes gene_type:complete